MTNADIKKKLSTLFAGHAGWLGSMDALLLEQAGLVRRTGGRDGHGLEHVALTHEGRAVVAAS